MELDHVILFLPSLAAAPLDLDQFTVEPGRRHTGQGTRNRRLVFERNYLELVWIEDLDELRTTGLDFEPRCAGAPGACPYGLCLRGRVPAAARERFAVYQQPDAPGSSLLILRGPVAAPFIAAFETDDVAARWPSTRSEPGYLHHPCGARSVAHLAITAPELPALDGIDLPGITFARGAPAITLDLGRSTIAIGEVQ